MIHAWLSREQKDFQGKLKTRVKEGEENGRDKNWGSVALSSNALFIWRQINSQNNFANTYFKISNIYCEALVIKKPTCFDITEAPKQ